MGPIFGRADGAPFDAEEFLRLHPQWNWQEGLSTAGRRSRGRNSPGE